MIMMQHLSSLLLHDHSYRTLETATVYNGTSIFCLEKCADYYTFQGRSGVCDTFINQKKLIDVLSFTLTN